MPGSIHLAGPGPLPVPAGEVALIALVTVLALLAIVIELVRRKGGRSVISNSQFWFRIAGGGLMLILALLLAGGALFTRPEDGRVFAWYWLLVGLLLIGLLIMLRSDVAATRGFARDVRQTMRDQRLQEMRSIIEDHERRRPSNASAPSEPSAPPDEPAGRPDP